MRDSAMGKTRIAICKQINSRDSTKNGSCLNIFLIDVPLHIHVIKLPSPASKPVGSPSATYWTGWRPGKPEEQSVMFKSFNPKCASHSLDIKQSLFR